MMLPLNSNSIHSLGRDAVRLITKKGTRLMRTMLPHQSNRQQKSKQFSLSEQLRAQIEVRGPLTVAAYMKAVLTSPDGGYYMHRDVLGRQGDFTTSPEITQLFGEMVGIWFVNEVNKFYPKAQPLQLVELGPGRGSLTADVLKVFKKLRGTEGLSVHLIEVSPVFSCMQAEKLCTENSIKRDYSLMSNSNNFFESKVAGRHYIIGKNNNSSSKETSFNTVTVHRPDHLSKKKDTKHYQKGIMEDGTPVFWYNSINEVPQNFSCFLAHEFFDALPVHKFKKTPDGWREILVSTDPEKGLERFKLIISRSATPTSKIFMKPWDEREEVEICPEGGLIAQQIASRLEENGGAALIIDYGHVGECTDTFRAFKNHKQVDPMISPGSADLTADVDFSYLRDAVSDKTVTFGPVTQSSFLKEMGIDLRLKVLLETCPDDQKSQLQSGYDMIMNTMGERFKFFSMFPSVLQGHLKRFPVAGFSSKEKS